MEATSFKSRKLQHSMRSVTSMVSATVERRWASQHMLYEMPQWLIIHSVSWYQSELCVDDEPQPSVKSTREGQYPFEPFSRWPRLRHQRNCLSTWPIGRNNGLSGKLEGITNPREKVLRRQMDFLLQKTEKLNTVSLQSRVSQARCLPTLKQLYCTCPKLLLMQSIHDTFKKVRARAKTTCVKNHPKNAQPVFSLTMSTYLHTIQGKPSIQHKDREPLILETSETSYNHGR